MDINSNDKWKEFISSNQSEFEDSEPSTDLWGKIESDLPNPKAAGKTVSLKRLFAVAAACLLLGIGATSWFYGSLMNSNEMTAQTNTQVDRSEQMGGSLGLLSAELGEVENYYIQEVSFKMAELKKYEVDEEWLIELELLQADFVSLQSALEEGANREKVIEAMIQNYRIRLSILEDLLEELEELEQSAIHFEV